MLVQLRPDLIFFSDDPSITDNLLWSDPSESLLTGSGLCPRPSVEFTS